MSILTDARQYPLVAVVDIDFNDIIVTAVAVDVLELPQNSVVTAVSLVIDVSFDNGTTADLDIGDATDPNRYTQTIAELDGVAGVPPTNEPRPDFFQTTDAEPNIVVTPTLTGSTLDEGSARLIVEYYVAGRRNENQGDAPEFQG